MFVFKGRKESLLVAHRVQVIATKSHHRYCITSCHYIELKRFYFQANNNIITKESRRSTCFHSLIVAIQIRRSSRQSCQTISKEQRRTFLSREDDTNITPSRPRLWGEMSPETQKLAQAIMNSTHNTIFAEDDAITRTHSGNYNDNHNGKATSQYEFKRKRHKLNMHPRVAISRAITLMESKHPFKKKQGDLLLTYLLSLSLSNSYDQKATIRIGFAGPPGTI